MIAPEVLKTMKAEYEAGATIYELSDLYGVGPTAIHRRLRKAGAALRKRGTKPSSTARLQRVVSLRDNGLLQKQIAYECGVTKQAVSNMLCRAGIRTYKTGAA